MPLAGRPQGGPASARPDLIRAENEKPGTTDWMLVTSRLDRRERWRSPQIEGFCSRTSVRAGETLAIAVSTRPPSPFVIDVYRLGYYGGKGGRHVLRLGPLKGAVQADPKVGSQRLRECPWEPAATLRIPAEWPSGVYLGKLTAERGGVQSYVIFIVRDDRRCDFLFQCSDTTWAAYNCWPTGWSLYHDGRKEWYSGPGVQVSWDRPYAKYWDLVDAPLSLGSGEFLLWEFPVAFWLEKRGYDVSYIGNVDTHNDGPGLLRAKAWLSIGHDEYWTMEMFENVQSAVSQGTHAGFFSSDTCWGVIRLLSSSRGASDRGITRIGKFGPVDPRELGEYPELALFEENAPSEAGLIGARNVYPYVGYADWICADEKSWIFEGTGMKNGDAIPGLVGWEIMGRPADIPGLRVVASGRIRTRGVEETYAATLYAGARGNFVFNASTCWWGDGLSAPPGYVRPWQRLRGPDPRVERITANLLDRFRA